MGCPDETELRDSQLSERRRIPQTRWTHNRMIYVRSLAVIGTSAQRAESAICIQQADRDEQSGSLSVAERGR
jgi:hypothetical protein